MWNRRKEEEYTPKPTTQPPTSVESAREGIPMSTMPARASAEVSRDAASIGKSVMVKGQIFGREDLYIDGEVEGTIEVQEHRLTVGTNGKVTASIKAREIVVLGTVHGNIDAGDKVDIRKDAKLVGDIKTARIVIEDGAYFKGSIDIIKPEISRAPQAPRPQPVAAVAAGVANAPPLVKTGAVETKS
jgi:cytoskeletal protein CcmA (bactofilin family)